MNEIVEIMQISEITTRSPFKDFFTINPVILGAIEDDMREYGFDASAPIRLWEKGNVVVDGHTRLQAAKNIGLKEVFVCMFDFDDDQGALKYAKHNQRNRRNMTDAALFKRIKESDKRIGRWPLNSPDSIKFDAKVDGEVLDNIKDRPKTSCEKTAEREKTTIFKVQEVRTILDAKNESLEQEIESGNKSIHSASEEIKQGKLKARPVTAQRNIAFKKFEKTMKKLIDEAVFNGIEVSQIKQVVKEVLKSKEASPCA